MIVVEADSISWLQLHKWLMQFGKLWLNMSSFIRSLCDLINDSYSLICFKSLYINMMAKI